MDMVSAPEATATDTTTMVSDNKRHLSYVDLCWGWLNFKMPTNLIKIDLKLNITALNTT